MRKVTFRGFNFPKAQQLVSVGQQWADQAWIHGALALHHIWNLKAVPGRSQFSFHLLPSHLSLLSLVAKEVRANFQCFPGCGVGEAIEHIGGWLSSDVSETGPYVSSTTPAVRTWARDFTSWSSGSSSRTQQCNTCLGLL